MIAKRRALLVAAAGLVVALAIVPLVIYLRSSGRVFVGPGCDASGKATQPLTLDGPLCAVVQLDEPLRGKAVIEVTVSRRVEGSWLSVNTLAWRAEDHDDQLYFRTPQLARLVGKQPGTYRLGFAREGRLLAEARFVVP